MRSHLVCSTNGNNYDVINISTLEGETCALINNWDMNWCPKLWSDIKFRNEFVEVLPEHVYAIGVHVAYMDKEKGFTCLFHRV